MIIFLNILWLAILLWFLYVTTELHKNQKKLKRVIDKLEQRADN